MAFLDTVPTDPSPMVVTVDFSNYENGSKYSTLFRSYFAEYQEQLGLAEGDYASYVALLLIDTLAAEVKKTMLASAGAASRDAMRAAMNMNEIAYSKI